MIPPKQKQACALPPSIQDELLYQGWTLGEHRSAADWVVTGSKGHLLIVADGVTVSEAWLRAADQARLLTILGELVN